MYMSTPDDFGVFTELYLNCFVRMAAESLIKSFKDLSLGHLASSKPKTLSMLDNPEVYDNRPFSYSRYCI